MHTYLMTLLLQYNVNNHIPDGTHYIRRVANCFLNWCRLVPKIVSDCVEQGLAEFQTPY